jgi:hypothetical protein
MGIETSANPEPTRYLAGPAGSTTVRFLFWIFAKERTCS